MLPSVVFCGLKVTRLVLGANPFGGFSHQDKQRDGEMLAYYTVERIKETWRRAETAGINTMITNNESLHVMQAVREYFHEGGRLQWVAQVNGRNKPELNDAIDEVVDMGCKAVYFHGALVDDAFRRGDGGQISDCCEYVRSRGIPAGVAGHAPEVHFWVDGLNAADFHAVCLFNCGSLHQGKGHRFKLSDVAPATDCIRRIQKPCIAYKIMGAGRIDPRMAFEYAFEQIKTTDVVNVGMYRGDNDDMVEENAAIAGDVLCCR